MKSFSFETEAALANMAAGLKRARLLRGDSQQLAADRIGTSIATYRRLESGDPATMGAMSAAVLLEALVIYGYQADVLSLGDPARDARAQELVTRRLPKNGRGPKRPSKVTA